MISIDQILYETFTNDSALMALLPGSVHSTWSTEGEYPRLIFDASMTSLNNEIQGGSLTIDVFGKGNNKVILEAIRTRVEYLLESQFFATDETGPTLRFWKRNHDTVPDDSPQIIHLIIQYDIRAARIRPS